MRPLSDFHIHTSRCGHACGSALEMAHAARDAGLEIIGITEHLSLPDGLDPLGEYAMGPGEVISYVAEVEEARSVLEGLRIVTAGEADWIPSRSEETARIREEARSAGVEVLLGSVHFLDDWAFDDPALIGEWDRRDVDAVWTGYFEQWVLAAQSGFFDVMAHPDLVKKFGHRASDSLTAELHHSAAKAAAAGGVLIEVSTAGLRKPVHEMYPSPSMLQAFAAAGVEATVGSDAHSPAEVGYRLDEALRACARAGYERVCVPLGNGEMRRYDL